MPIFTVPIHEPGPPLREFNQCHHPAGSHTGGQFCSDIGGVLPSPIERNRAREHFEYLMNRRATLDDVLLANDPQSSIYKSAVTRMKALVKEITHLQADTGGLEGLGLPGGPRDVVVIGGGPGGLTAATGAGYEELDTLLIEGSESPGGQSARSSRVQNHPAFPTGAKGREIAEKGFTAVQQNGVETMLGVRVTAITYDPDTEMKTLTLSNGQTVLARTVIVAVGGTPRPLTVAGPGKTQIPIVEAGAAPATITYNAEKLAAQSKGKSIIVVGGGNAAAQAARGAAVHAAGVTVLARSDISDMSKSQQRQLRNNPKIKVLEGVTITKVTTDASGRQLVHLSNGQTVGGDMIGGFVGAVPNIGWLPKELELRGGKIHVDLHRTETTTPTGKRTRHAMETNIPGVFAIGDVRAESGQRIAAAIGDGAIAVKEVFPYFEQLKRRHGRLPKT